MPLPAALSVGLAVSLSVCLAPSPAAAGYRYGGYTPLHDHAGERAQVDAPTCGVRLTDSGDHDAAYVDVSNEKATMWGQAGWWIGTSGSGRYFAAPVGYIEYRLSDGTYLWRSLGPPPRGARYSVVSTGRVMHDAAGRAYPLYRITASFVPGTLALYPYPAPSGDNAGLAESYSGAGATEPIGPASYRHVALADRGRWRLWTPPVDGASRTVAAGDHVRLDARWHRWHVSGHLGGGATSAGAAKASPVALSRRATTDRWRLYAPPLLMAPGGSVQVGAIAADRRARLVGTGLRADGHLVLWRWRPGTGLAPEVWQPGDLRALVGEGDAAGWVALPEGASAYAAGYGILRLPAGQGRVGVTVLGSGGPILAASAGPGGSVALVRGAGPVLELWRAVHAGEEGTGGFVLAARLALPPAAGHPDALAYLGGGEWLADRPDGARNAYGRTFVLSLAGSGRLAGRAARAGAAAHVAAAAGVAAAEGGDRGAGVRVRSPRGAWRAPRALAGAAVWGDALAVGQDGRVWATTRRSLTSLVGWRRGEEAVRIGLPPLWVREDPPRGPGAGGPLVAAPPYGVSLAAGPGWVAAAPEGESLVLVALRRPSAPARPPARAGGRSRRRPSP